jgi:hypothetical protein
LELVALRKSDLLGRVLIAGTFVGEISLAIVKIFVREPQSMMQLPELQSDLVNRVPELTDTPELIQQMGVEEDF